MNPKADPPLSLRFLLWKVEIIPAFAVGVRNDG